VCLAPYRQARSPTHVTIESSSSGEFHGIAFKGWPLMFSSCARCLSDPGEYAITFATAIEGYRPLQPIHLDVLASGNAVRVVELAPTH
jgi:hypothetical protein